MEYRKISDIKKLPNNPRTIKDKDFLKLVNSIKDNPDYFEARPIILSDRTGELVIIAGNQRYEAAKHLKLKEVPTHLLSGLIEDKEKEIIIRDNVNNGDWNYDILVKDWDIKTLLSWGLEYKTPTSKDPADIKIYKLWQITIDFKDEKELKDNFDILQKLGYTCSILQI
jgi:hypothetical protein